MLGHLFSLPSIGGTAEQLTFGPHYDNDPAFSPDGSQVAFTSDRDGSDGNIFVLTLRDRQLRQLTHEARAGRSAWSPDGNAIMYLRYER
jgi:Tol biopolymer transport system component